MKRLATFALFGLVSLSTSYATTVTAAGGQVAAQSITYSGTTIATSSGSLNFGSTPNPLSGTYTESVVRDSTTGFLDFVYSVTDTTTGYNSTYPGILEGVSMASFTGFTTDIGYVAGTGTSPVPMSMGRTEDVVNFSWNGFNGSNSTPIDPGETIPTLVIKTDASYYTLGTLGATDGIGGNATVYGPTSTPEPVSMSLLGGGLFIIGGLRLRRKATR